MYFGENPNFTSVVGFVGLIKRYCIGFSIIGLCLYVWLKFLSPPIEYEELSRLEGVVVEKWREQVYRGGDEFLLRIKATDGIYKVRQSVDAVSDCCFLEDVPLNKPVSLLTDGGFGSIFFYQISHGNRVILDAHDVLAQRREPTVFVYLVPLLFLVGALAFCIELVLRKARKSTS